MSRAIKNLIKPALLAVIILSLYCMVALVSGAEPADPEARYAFPFKGIVNSNKLNVRAQAGIQSEVVCVLEKGAEVEIKRLVDDWYGIAAPTNTETWIAADRLADNRVINDHTPVYAGPGELFSAYLTLSKDDIVEILNRVGHRWVHIKPPADTIVWVNASFITVDRESMRRDKSWKSQSRDEQGHDLSKQLVEQTVAPATLRDGMIVDPLVPAALPAETIPVGTPRSVTRQGELITLKLGEQRSIYALAIAINQRYYPLAYLSMPNGDLAVHLGKQVEITGEESWIKGWPRPLIQVETVERIEAPLK